MSVAYFASYRSDPSYRPGKDYDASGIRIEYDPQERTVTVSGYYDGGVEIDGETVTLEEFLTRIGINSSEIVQ